MAQAVVEIIEDDATGLKFVEDIRGFWYLLQEPQAEEIINEFYLQDVVDGHTWVDTTTFQSLPTPLTSQKNEDSYISFVVASHDFKNSYGTGAVGIFINGTMKMALPFTDNITYVAYKPILIPATSLVEVKYRPFNTKARLGVTVRLFTIL